MSIELPQMDSTSGVKLLAENTALDVELFEGAALGGRIQFVEDDAFIVYTDKASADLS
jgi:hypothetical protein